MTKPAETPGQLLDIQRIYIKDVSLETPAVPEIFNKENWQPEANIEIEVKNKNLEQDVYEVILIVTVTAKIEEKTVFLIEAHQAGIFAIAGFEEEQLDHILGAYCPTVLFPYVRETISDLVSRASFPQLNLTHVNFDALYFQEKENNVQTGSSSQEEKTKH